MRSSVKKILLVFVVVLNGTAIIAQEKKDPLDIAYVQQKRQMDAQRVRETEQNRVNNDMEKVRLRDSLDDVRRSDSIRYSKMGRQDTIVPGPTKRDSIYPNIPPKLDDGIPPNMDEGVPPKRYDKGEPPKGT